MIERSQLHAAIGAPVLAAAGFTLFVYPFALLIYYLGNAEYAMSVMFTAIPRVWAFMLALSVLFTGTVVASAVWKWSVMQHSPE